MVIVAGSSGRIGPNIKFYGEILWQIVLLLHERSDIRVPAGKLDGLLAVDGHDFAFLSAQKIPVTRELSKAFPLYRIVEENLVSGDEVALGIAGLDGLRLRGGGRRGFGGLDGGCGLRSGRLFLRRLTLLVFLGGGLVDGVSDGLFHFFSHLFFHGLLGPFSDVAEDALGVRAAGCEQQHREDDDQSFHLCVVFSVFKFYWRSR